MDAAPGCRPPTVLPGLREASKPGDTDLKLVQTVGGGLEAAAWATVYGEAQAADLVATRATVADPRFACAAGAARAVFAGDARRQEADILVAHVARIAGGPKTLAPRAVAPLLLARSVLQRTGPDICDAPCSVEVLTRDAPAIARRKPLRADDTEPPRQASSEVRSERVAGRCATALRPVQGTTATCAARVGAGREDGVGEDAVVGGDGIVDEEDIPDRLIHVAEHVEQPECVGEQLRDPLRPIAGGVVGPGDGRRGGVARERGGEVANVGGGRSPRARSILPLGVRRQTISVAVEACEGRRTTGVGAVIPVGCTGAAAREAVALLQPLRAGLRVGEGEHGEELEVLERPVVIGVRGARRGPRRRLEVGGVHAARQRLPLSLRDLGASDEEVTADSDLAEILAEVLAPEFTDRGAHREETLGYPDHAGGCTTVVCGAVRPRRAVVRRTVGIDRAARAERERWNPAGAVDAVEFGGAVGPIDAGGSRCKAACPIIGSAVAVVVAAIAALLLHADNATAHHELPAAALEDPPTRDLRLGCIEPAVEPAPQPRGADGKIGIHRAVPQGGDE